MRHIFALFYILMIASFANADGEFPPSSGSNDFCFAANYGDGYMKAHPRQAVNFLRFEVKSDLYEKGTLDTDMGQIGFLISARYKGSPNVYNDIGKCLPLGGKLSCHVECDGAKFVITNQEPDEISLHNIENMIISGCDGEGYTGQINTNNQQVFKLQKLSKQQCSANY